MTDLTTLEHDPDQADAIARCCDTTLRIVSVTGSAGTGKTTIIKVVYQALTDAGYTVVLAAPTGKAAKRISEATGVRACTIHKLLMYTNPGERDPETGKIVEISFPRKDHNDPLHYDVVIIDEYAMVPHALHRNVIDALKRGARLRCFGDINQLPPIDDTDGPSPFQTLLRGIDFPVVRLNKIHRHGEGSTIVTNGARILRGMVPTSMDANFAVSSTDQPVRKLMSVLKTLSDRGEKMFDNIHHQIITPQKRGQAGTWALNAIIADFYNLDTDFVTIERQSWEVKQGSPRVTIVRVGQKVIVTQNIYDLRPELEMRVDINGKLINPQPYEQVFNGESGIVVSVDDDNIVIDLGDRIVSIPPYLEYLDRDGNVKVTDARKYVELAYAITTHKAQGSEYDGVIYLISKAASFNQCRSNFYTAITRAKRQVSVIGDSKSIGFFSMKAIAGWQPKR